MAKKHGKRTNHRVRKKEKPLIEKKTANQVYSAEVLLRVSDMYRSGITEDSKVAEALGIAPQTFCKWIKKYPELKKIREEHKAAINSVLATDRFIEYVFNRLPENLQEYWMQLQEYENEPTAQLKIESLLKDAGKQARQHLFIHALVACNFNVSYALSKVNLNKKTFESWMEDPCFNDLYQEMLWHKKNFIEGMLMQAIKAGDTAAVIFANKTLNQDRGYNPAKKVQVEGQVDHDHEHKFDLSKAPLSLRMELLKFMEAQQPKPVGQIVDVTNESSNSEQ